MQKFDNKFAIGAICLSLASFAGCGSGPAPEAEAVRMSDIRDTAQGMRIATIYTASGDWVQHELQQILNDNPTLKIAEFERTGSYENVTSGGTGFIVVLEPAESRRNYKVAFIPTTNRETTGYELQQLLDTNPTMTLTSVERTGPHQNITSGGAGLLIILENAPAD